MVLILMIVMFMPGGLVLVPINEDLELGVLGNLLNHLKKMKILSGFRLVPNILPTTLEMALILLRNMILRKRELRKENVTLLKQSGG